MSASKDEIKQAVAAYRQVERESAGAKAAKDASSARIADLQKQLDAETKLQADLDTKATAAAKAVEEAGGVVASKLEPGALWSEDGKTAFFATKSGKFIEASISYLNGGTS